MSLVRPIIGDANGSEPPLENCLEPFENIAHSRPCGKALVGTHVTPLEETIELAQITSSCSSSDVAVHIDQPGAEEALEVVAIVPYVPTRGGAVNMDLPPVEESREFMQVAPCPSPSETALNIASPPVEEAAETMAITPYLPSGDPAANIDPPSVEEAAALVQVTSPFSWGEAMMSSNAPEVEGTTEPGQIAPRARVSESLSSLREANSQEVSAEQSPQPLPADATKAATPPPGFLTFYGLAEQPFGVTPDPTYLYPSTVHREALESISHGIENLRGFMVLVAEPGMGKTTLLNKLMEELTKSTRTVFFFQTQCNSREFFRYLLDELGVASTGMDLVAMHKALNEILFHEMLQGRRFVLIVDEAQNLQESVLETIRLLSDYETTHAKLIQIVLAGQPQLVDKLKRPGLSQLRQRIAVLNTLKPLEAAETVSYIEHRLRAAGCGDRVVFTPDAKALIAERSKGAPRSINNLCANAIMLGYAERRSVIDSDIVQRVAEKLDLESLAQWPEQNEVVSTPEPVAAADSSTELLRLMLSALGSRVAPEPSPSPSPVDQVKPEVVITGKLTELVKCRHRGKESEYRIQVSLERESSPEITIADRYYCCIFYVPEEQAKGFHVGQTIRIRLCASLK